MKNRLNWWTMFFSMFLLLAVPFLSAAAESQAKSLKVLAIGNSFSDDATAHLYQLAEDCGATEIVIGKLSIGGCSLQRHWNNAKNNLSDYGYYKNTNGKWVSQGKRPLLYGLKDEEWDFITLQQVSGLSGIASTYNSDLDNLVAYIEENKNANAKLVWHQTWAYQSTSTHSDFGRYNNDQLTMYNAIVEAVRTKIEPRGYFALIIPSGTAIQNVRMSYLGDTLTRDGYHLSLNLGRYIAGLTWLKALTGWSIEDISYVPSEIEIPAAYLPLIKEAVNHAVENKYGIPFSSYQEK